MCCAKQKQKQTFADMFQYSLIYMLLEAASPKGFYSLEKPQPNYVKPKQWYDIYGTQG